MRNYGQLTEYVDVLVYMSSIREQRALLCIWIGELCDEDKRRIFGVLVGLIGGDKVNIHGAGSSINLDKIDDKIISTLFDLIRSIRFEVSELNI